MKRGTLAALTVALASSMAVAPLALAKKKKKTTTTTTTTTTATSASGSSAWAAAQTVLPAGLNLVVGVNATTLMSSKFFTTAMDKVWQEQPEAKQYLDMVKSTCGIDPMTSIKDVVVAMNMDSEKGAFFIGLNGIDKTKFTDCATKFATKAGITLNATASGNIVEYSAKGQSDKLYVGWASDSVLVISSNPEDKSSLTDMLGGKGALLKDGDFGTGLGKVNTSAMAWGVITKKDLGGDVQIKVMYGHLDDVSGKVSAELHVVLGSSADATKAAKEANDGLASMGDQLKSLPTSLQNIAKSIKVTASGSEVAISASATESDIADTIDQVAKGGL